MGVASVLFCPMAMAKCARGYSPPLRFRWSDIGCCGCISSGKQIFFLYHSGCCIQAFYKRFRQQANLEYITSDLYSPLADVKADICALPFENEQFDVVLCNHVLEHIPDDTQAMRELYRVLKKGGWGIFQVPQEIERAETFADDSITDPKERARIFGQYDHVRIYGMDYFDKLRSIGFSVLPLPCTEVATAEEIEKYRLVKNEILPICSK